MQHFAQNAKSPKRRLSYELVTTISKGYDAPCCAAIAKAAECDTAVTFNETGKYIGDSGVEVAERLGYSKVIERVAMAYKKRDDYIEAYYVCTGELGSAISFSAFDEDFRNKAVLAGIRGDLIWGIESKDRNNNFRFTNILSQLGYSESRLWVGYIHVPMPLFGASAWESIYNIFISDEMKPWSLENDYDRPIPRRIVEESGVPRQLFGVDKHGAGFNYHFDWLKRIENKMSEASAKDFEAYVKKQPPKEDKATSRMFRLLCTYVENLLQCYFR